MHTKQRGNTNVVLLLSFGVLLFISGSIAGFFIWKHFQEKDVDQPPAYVNLGKVVAQVGGGRFIRTDVQLEVSSHEVSGLFQVRNAQVLDGVRRGFSQVSEQDIYTREGKRAAQEAIIAHLNHYFGRPLVQSVYFSDFLIAGG